MRRRVAVHDGGDARRGAADAADLPLHDLVELGRTRHCKRSRQKLTSKVGFGTRAGFSTQKTRHTLKQGRVNLGDYSTETFFSTHVTEFPRDFEYSLCLTRSCIMSGVSVCSTRATLWPLSMSVLA